MFTGHLLDCLMLFFVKIQKLILNVCRFYNCKVTNYSFLKVSFIFDVFYLWRLFWVLTIFEKCPNNIFKMTVKHTHFPLSAPTSARFFRWPLCHDQACSHLPIRRWTPVYPENRLNHRTCPQTGLRHHYRPGQGQRRGQREERTC